MHGGLTPRGIQLTGKVVSDKAKRTVIVETDFARYVYKYERFLERGRGYLHTIRSA